MANIRITDLPLAVALDGTEELPIVQSGTTKKTTVAAIAGEASFEVEVSPQLWINRSAIMTAGVATTLFPEDTITGGFIIQNRTDEVMMVSLNGTDASPSNGFPMPGRAFYQSGPGEAQFQEISVYSAIGGNVAGASGPAWPILSTLPIITTVNQSNPTLLAGVSTLIASGVTMSLMVFNMSSVSVYLTMDGTASDDEEIEIVAGGYMTIGAEEVPRNEVYAYADSDAAIAVVYM